MPDPDRKEPELIIDLNEQPGHWLVPGSGDAPQDGEEKNAELIGMIPGDQIDGESLIRLFAKIKGRPCTEEEIDGFNAFGKKWQADLAAQNANEAGRAQ
jgi:hypothetical protein